MQQVEAGLVGGKPRAHLLHAAEGAYCDVAVRLAVPRTPPTLQLQQFLRSFSHEGFDGVLIAEPVAAGDSVVGVFVGAVVGLGDTGCGTFGRDRVAAHGVYLRHYADAELGIDLSDGDRRAQPRTASSHEKYVVR